MVVVLLKHRAVGRVRAVVDDLLRVDPEVPLADSDALVDSVEELAALLLPPS